MDENKQLENLSRNISPSNVFLPVVSETPLTYVTPTGISSVCMENSSRQEIERDTTEKISIQDQPGISYNIGVLNSEVVIPLSSIHQNLHQEEMSSIQSNALCSEIPPVADRSKEQIGQNVQISESVVLKIENDMNRGLPQVVQLDSSVSDSDTQNTEMRTSLQNLIQLLQLQQGSVQIELPASMSSDQSVLLTDIIQNSIPQTAVSDSNASYQSDIPIVISNSMVLGNVAMVTPVDNGKDTITMVTADKDGVLDTTIPVETPKPMVSLLKNFPKTNTPCLPITVEAMETSYREDKEEDVLEKSDQRNCSKEIESLRNKKEILISLLENIKTQIEIFRTAITDIKIEAMPLDSNILETSRFLYQMLQPILELSADIKQFADQAQLSWKQDSGSQTDYVFLGMKNVSTQTPSVSSVSGREIRLPSRYHVNDDSDSENESPKSSKRKRKQPVRYLQSSKAINLNEKIVFIPATSLKTENSESLQFGEQEQAIKEEETSNPAPAFISYIQSEADSSIQQEDTLNEGVVKSLVDIDNISSSSGNTLKSESGMALSLEESISVPSTPVEDSQSQGVEAVLPTSPEKSIGEEPCQDTTEVQTLVNNTSNADKAQQLEQDKYIEEPNSQIVPDNVNFIPVNSEPVPSDSVIPEAVACDSLTSDTDSTIPQTRKVLSGMNDNLISKHDKKDSFPKIKSGKGKKKTWKDYDLMTQFKFFCQQCSFKTKRQSHYLKHVKYHEKQYKLYECKQCNFKTIRNSELRKHEISHSNSLLSCSMCKYVTDDPLSMTRHNRRKHYQQVQDHFMCLICKFKSVTLKKLEAHMQKHKDPGEDPVTLLMEYSCDQCSYKTKRKEHFVRHKNNVHSDHRPYLCDLCGQAFKRTDALSQHKLVHIDRQKRKYRFVCTKCNKEFRSQSHLQEHMAMHSSERHHLCYICGASFKTKSSQQKHIKNLHQSPRSFSCPTCDKKFNTNYALKRHERTHELRAFEKTAVNILTSQEFLNQAEVTVNTQTLPQELVQVQDIIPTPIDETYEAANDKLQQALSSLNSENATAIMYLSSTWT